MTEHSDDLSRRRFVRKVGAGLVSITVVDLLFGAKPVFADCGEGVSDSTCGMLASYDQNCTVTGDADNNCSRLTLSDRTDSNCGSPTTNGTVAGPNGTDVDESCSSNSSDENCGVSYNPTPSHDPDDSCSSNSTDADQSCGDCNDNHQPDDHCGEELTGGATDSDELCGHQHTFTGTPDNVCSASEPDAGCGTHSNDYAPINWPDADQYCSATHTDRNCSEASSDATCNASHSPSSTSPDENCSGTDVDAACSLYDRDESCGNGSKDEACGITTVEGWPDTTDKDANCSPPGDPDSSGGFPCPLGGG